jgi:hypothetical protein
MKEVHNNKDKEKAKDYSPDVSDTTSNSRVKDEGLLEVLSALVSEGLGS